MAYLGLSPDYPDQYFSEIPSPGDADNCARYCAWLASRKGGIVTMEYMERPPGCTCPGEVDAKKQGFPVTKTGAEQYDLIEERVQPGLYKPTPTTLPAPLPSPGTIQLTPQQIEAQVKQIQPAPAGGGLVLAAIVAFLILGA